MVLKQNGADCVEGPLHLKMTAG